MAYDFAVSKIHRPILGPPPAPYAVVRGGGRFPPDKVAEA